MKKPLLSLLLTFLSGYLIAQDLCSAATELFPGADCSYTDGTLYNATQTGSPSSSCGAARYDVWYRFTPVTGQTFVTISVVASSVPTSVATDKTYIELFNSTTCTNATAANTRGCGNITTSRTYTVTPGTQYYFRVYTENNPNSNAAQWTFKVCVTSNNNCATATTIVAGGTNLTGSVHSASASTGVPAPCSGDAGDDVWYKFSAVNSYATVTLSSISSGLTSSGAMFQVFSGTCGTLSQIGCTSSRQVNLTGLSIGATYYIRVYSSGASNVGSNASGHAFYVSVGPGAPVAVQSGRLKEIYQQTTISAPQVLLDPWEVAYGADGYLWITEAKGSRIYRMDPVTGVRDTVLNISQGSTFFSTPTETEFNLTFNPSSPQGGLAGMAFHPKFLATTGAKNYVYVSYIHTNVSGSIYRNRIARFEYNATTKRLESPVAICDTIPGSNDHNSQRMIVAPVGNTHYLFYAAGDMGAGQFSNQNRPQNAQDLRFYEGKILRFNLEPDPSEGTYEQWIPNDNPFSVALGKSSAVWCYGIRNNQGFAFDTARKILYGASHGPHSDDEINIIESGKNYGHPLVIGYKADQNYNGISAGAKTANSCPVIVDEAYSADSMGLSYKDPLYSAYPRTQSEIYNHWINTTPNGTWPSEGWSGMDFYSNKLIPGWKDDLIVASLKWGRLLKFRLKPAGDSVVKTAGFDTVSLFGSVNRFRDLAFSADGKDMYVVMDRSATTSGPSAANPVIPGCGGCVQKYTFLGYNSDGSGKSEILKAIDISEGSNGCNTGTTININDANKAYWVPITGPDGNIVAEIKSNNQNLGTITSSYYKNGGAIRQYGGKKYMDRSITINMATPGSPVSVRLYFTGAEFEALKNSSGSGIVSINDIRVLKNNDACVGTISNSTTLINPTVKETHDTTGYVVQFDVSSFSTFYFGSQAITLPVNLVSFTGELVNNTSVLQWKTAQEVNASHFEVERSIDGNNFNHIGSVTATGINNAGADYTYLDHDVTTLNSNLVYYRLRIVDKDGQFSYSSIVTISINRLTGKLSVAPNPATRLVYVTVTTESNGRSQWKLVDNAGRVVMSSSAELKKGVNTFPVNLEKLAAGIYYFNIQGAGIDQHVKVQKL